jgi:hypothetical protein
VNNPATSSEGRFINAPLASDDEYQRVPNEWVRDTGERPAEPGHPHPIVGRRSRPGLPVDIGLSTRRGRPAAGTSNSFAICDHRPTPDEQHRSRVLEIRGDTHW